MADLYARLLARTDHLSDVHRALRAVVELHAPIWRDLGWMEDGDTEYAEIEVCGHCVRKHSVFASRAAVPEGPCSTIRTIADQLGLTQDQEQHREEDRRG